LEGCCKVVPADVTGAPERNTRISIIKIGVFLMDGVQPPLRMLHVTTDLNNCSNGANLLSVFQLPNLPSPGVTGNTCNYECADTTRMPDDFGSRSPLVLEEPNG
jgi:hypothetical protein